jgi:tetratricopeptide (TPR) repeat protein
LKDGGPVTAGYHRAEKDVLPMAPDPDAAAAASRIAAVRPADIAALFQEGVRLHQAGRFAQAEAIYDRVLAARADHPGALHLTGVLDIQRGRPAQAVAKIRAALAVNPRAAPFHGNLGTALQALGRDDEALAAYREAVRLDPAYADAHNNIGALAEKRARYRDAVDSYRAALAARPDFLEAMSNLGQLLRRAGEYKEAVALLTRAVELGAKDAATHRALGAALGRLDRHDEAIAALRRAIEIDPNDHEAHNQLGNRFKHKGMAREAEASYRTALQIKPDYVDAHNNLGNLAYRVGKLEEAESFYRAALRIRPDYADGHGNLGIVHMGMGRYEEAVATLREALRLRSVYPEATSNLSQALLVMGAFKEGWDKYEMRWKLPALAPRPFRQPLWHGESLIGTTILLHAEQGAGDVIQFVRYAPLIRDLGATVVVELPKELMRVLAPIAGPRIRLVAKGSPLPHFDVHCPLLSLPGALGCDLGNIPASVPYLTAEPDLVARWRARLDGAPGPRIGLVWAGNPQHANDHNRSFRPLAFKPFWDIPGLRFFLLQKQPRDSDAADLAELGPHVDLGPELQDFADTAAALSALDLLISADTSIVHLAGALGRPVWTMVPFSPDWRWLLGREDTPWYPTMRLFRQPKRRDWRSAMARVAEELARLRGPG